MNLRQRSPFELQVFAYLLWKSALHHTGRVILREVIDRLRVIRQNGHTSLRRQCVDELKNELTSDADHILSLIHEDMPDVSEVFENAVVRTDKLNDFRNVLFVAT